nr:hypothetical protein Iba_chr07eCG0190 [Ipomoea batatas]
MANKFMRLLGMAQTALGLVVAMATRENLVAAQNDTEKSERTKKAPVKHLPKVSPGIGVITANKLSSVNNVTFFHISAGGPETFLE